MTTPTTKQPFDFEVHNPYKEEPNRAGITIEQVVQCDYIRAAFERRFRGPPFEFSLELYGEQDAWPGSYKKYSEQCAWDGYQEARADLEAENAELAERLRLSEALRVSDMAELESLRNVIQLAADDIRRCDYTPARSKLLTAIAAAPKEK